MKDPEHIQHLDSTNQRVTELEEQLAAMTKERDEAKEYAANFQRTFRGHVYIKNEEWAEVNNRLRASQAREAKIQKILDGLNSHLAAWREDY
jgi:chromosome segregation ATPase